jgi:hypothetical protein
MLLNSKNINTKMNLYADNHKKLREAYTLLVSVPKNINILKKHINNNNHEIHNLTNDAMMAAASGIIWLQSTYDLNIMKMTEGKLMSKHAKKYQSVDKPIISESLYFEDLLQISRAAMEIGLYAVAIKFFIASLISHQENKCTFKRIDNSCRPYQFDSLENWYLAKHDYSLLNQTAAAHSEFDSAERFPFRIKKG